MAERIERLHGLEPRLERLRTGVNVDAALAIEVMASLAHVNLRGNPGDARFVEAVESVLKQPLPLEPNTVSTGGHRLCWLGPDEWLLTTPHSGLAPMLGELERVLDGLDAAFNDLSGGQVLLRLRGDIRHEVLGAGCTLDLHPSSFAPGHCAQTGLAKAGVLLCPVEGEGGIDVVVRRSYSDYLVQWFADVAGARGVAISVS